MSEEKYFQRGNKVRFLGGKNIDGKEYPPITETYIWGVNPHEIVSYIIEHPNGYPKEHFRDENFPDGFEAVHSKDLKDGLKYISIYHENQLELIESCNEPIPVSWHSGLKFKRGDKVNYRPQNFKKEEGEEATSGDVSVKFVKDDRLLRIQNGGISFKPINGTYVWTHFGHLMFEGYVIQHPDGFDKRHFINDPDGDFNDGFEAVHSSELKDGLKYIWADESELELCKEKEKPKATQPVTPPLKAVHVQKTEVEQERMYADIDIHTSSVDEAREIIKTLHKHHHKLSDYDELRFIETPYRDLKYSGVVFRVWCKSNNPMAFYYLGQAIYKEIDVPTRIRQGLTDDKE